MEELEKLFITILASDENLEQQLQAIITKTKQFFGNAQNQAAVQVKVEIDATAATNLNAINDAIKRSADEFKRASDAVAAYVENLGKIPTGPTPAPQAPPPPPVNPQAIRDLTLLNQQIIVLTESFARARVAPEEFRNSLEQLGEAIRIAGASIQGTPEEVLRLDRALNSLQQGYDKLSGARPQIAPDSQRIREATTEIRGLGAALEAGTRPSAEVRARLVELKAELEALAQSGRLTAQQMTDLQVALRNIERGIQGTTWQFTNLSMAQQLQFA